VLVPPALCGGEIYRGVRTLQIHLVACSVGHQVDLCMWVLALGTTAGVQTQLCQWSLLVQRPNQDVHKGRACKSVSLLLVMLVMAGQLTCRFVLPRLDPAPVMLTCAVTDRIACVFSDISAYHPQR
jgi:hypothetical protein